MACAAAIFQVLAHVSFGSLLSDIVIANDWLILINVLSVCLSVCFCLSVNKYILNIKQIEPHKTSAWNLRNVLEYPYIKLYAHVYEVRLAQNKLCYLAVILPSPNFPFMLIYIWYPALMFRLPFMTNFVLFVRAIYCVLKMWTALIRIISIRCVRWG